LPLLLRVNNPVYQTLDETSEFEGVKAFLTSL